MKTLREKNWQKYNQNYASIRMRTIRSFLSVSPILPFFRWQKSTKYLLASEPTSVRLKSKSFALWSQDIEVFMPIWLPVTAVSSYKNKSVLCTADEIRSRGHATFSTYFRLFKYIWPQFNSISGYGNVFKIVLILRISKKESTCNKNRFLLKVMFHGKLIICN